MAEKTASLTVLGGPFAGTRCALPESGSVTIGSAPGSTLQIDLPGVSPFHARIEVEAGRVTVHDTGAERELHVNDNPLEPGGTVLRNGDILWLGVPGEEDVVMLQCVLPRRPAEAPSPAAEPPAAPGPATPTPEVETQALWSFGEAPQTPHGAAEPLRQEPTGHEEARAILPEGFIASEEPPKVEAPPAAAAPAEEALVFAEPSLPGATEGEVVAAVEVPEVAAESAAFVDDAEAVVVDATEVAAPPSPTILMASPDEMAEPQPVSIDFGDTAAGEAVPAPAPAVVEPEPAPPPVPPRLPAAPVPSPPAAAAPPLPAARPAPPARPPAPRPAARPSRPSARREAPRATPVRPAPPAGPPPALEPEAPEALASAGGGRRSMLLALAGLAGVLVVAGLGWVAWRFLAGGPSEPRPTPRPVARATMAPEARPQPTPMAVEPTAEPAATPTPAATARPETTPLPTPTPRATPTPPPAAARPTPTPPATPAGPSAEALRAQQAAAEAQSLVAQAETAIAARQYDAAVSHLDNALRLDPANARAASLRPDAVRRRDLARRRFAAGRTAVETQKAQRAGGPAGFDTGDAEVRTSDFLGRIEFEMSPASGIEPGDAWTLRVYVVNEGRKAIRVQGVSVGTSVNGTASGGPVPPRAREIAPQQRTLVAETTGSWHDGTTAWATEVTVTAGKGESLKNTLTWR
jgi:hypothetical protein